MKLIELLAIPGTHVWPFTRDTPMKTVTEAHRRLQTYLTYDNYRHVAATASGVVMTDVKNYGSEPALIIEVTHRKHK